MKTISLLQPWASLIAIGAKGIETRSWATKYRGPLAIHASKKWDTKLQAITRTPVFYNALWPQYNGRYVSLHARQLPLGAVIATCNLVDCIKMTPEFIWMIESPELDFGEYAVGRYAWILEDVKPLDVPIPAKGALSLWDWEVEK